MAATDFIVAIELGSSKITGIAGKKHADGSIQVLALASENSSDFIREHIIFLGKPGNYEEKFEKLKTFYEKGLNQVGWNKYSRISLEFNNQIICTKKEK